MTTQPTAPSAEAAAPAAEAAKPAPPPERGYPTGTPVEQMSMPEQLAYARAQSRKHEDRVKALDGITPEDLAALRDKASRHDSLERELMSDRDKAIAEATDKVRAEATPRVVRAEFKAAAKGILNAEQLAALLEDRNLAAYANAKGEPDEAKIEKLIKAFAPTPHTGPSPNGLGNRRAAATAPGEAGRLMAERRFGTKTA